VIAMTLVALVISNGPIFAALPIITLPLAAAPARAVRNGATGPNLIAVLGATARLHLVFSLLLAVGLALSVQ
jgi:1,4-dihydroxy-2-naphthoate octaprenyltransferase